MAFKKSKIYFDVRGIVSTRSSPLYSPLDSLKPNVHLRANPAEYVSSSGSIRITKAETATDIATKGWGIIENQLVL